MSKKISSSKKGFTLIEILIVITLMAFLSTAAIGQSLNAQREFAFLDTFKQVLAKVREPRLYAVTNFTIPVPPAEGTGLIIPEIFGVVIDKSNTDGTQNPNHYVIKVGGGSLNGGEDPYFIGKQLEIDSSKYELDVVNIESYQAGPDPFPTVDEIGSTTNCSEEGSGCSVLAIYEPPYADFMAMGNLPAYYDLGENGVINESIVIKLMDRQKTNLTRYIVIFQGSGVAEGFYAPSASKFVEKITGTPQ